MFFSEEIKPFFQNVKLTVMGLLPYKTHVYNSFQEYFVFGTISFEPLIYCNSITSVCCQLYFKLKRTLLVLQLKLYYN